MNPISDEGAGPSSPAQTGLAWPYSNRTDRPCLPNFEASEREAKCCFFFSIGDVHEQHTVTPGGDHVVISMERTSTTGVDALGLMGPEPEAPLLQGATNAAQWPVGLVEIIRVRKKQRKHTPTDKPQIPVGLASGLRELLRSNSE